jgi:uncharacterized membrane protein
MQLIINRNIIVFLILVCIAAISNLIPPFQSPDEDVHLLRADMIAHGQWLLQPKDGGSGREGGLVDANLQLFASTMLRIAGVGVNKTLAPDLVATADTVRWSGLQTYAKAAGTGYYLPIIYAPHALGLYISRQLDLTMKSSYALTRCLVFLTSVSLIAWALSLYTPNVLTWMLLLTPMALFQISSPTIDGLCSALALVVIGLWLHVLTHLQINENNKISIKELILYALIFILCTARTNLLPLLFIPIILLFNNFSRSRLIIALVLFSLTLGWIVFGVASVYDDRVVREHSTLEVATAYLAHPFEFVDLFAQTLGDKTIRRFYRDSFFGILGWLDSPIPRQTVRVLAVVTTFTAFIMIVKTRWREAFTARAALVFIGLGGTILIFFAMAITWTAYPAQTILGIQGRYFLIPCLFMAAALGNYQLGAVRINRLEIIIIFSFALYSLHALTSTLISQYRMVNFNF